jgi:hypothetical protein
LRNASAEDLRTAVMSLMSINVVRWKFGESKRWFADCRQAAIETGCQPKYAAPSQNGTACSIPLASVGAPRQSGLGHCDAHQVFHCLGNALSETMLLQFMPIGWPRRGAVGALSPIRGLSSVMCWVVRFEHSSSLALRKEQCLVAVGRIPMHCEEWGG